MTIKKIFRLILIALLLPIFLPLLLALLVLILLLMGFYSLFAGRKWVSGIKWYTRTAKGIAVKEEFKRQDRAGTPSGDSVYDVRYDVLMSSPSSAAAPQQQVADEKKPVQEGGRPVA